MKKIIGLSVITGVVVFAYLRSLGGKVDRSLATRKKEHPQLV